MIHFCVLLIINYIITFYCLSRHSSSAKSFAYAICAGGGTSSFRLATVKNYTVVIFFPHQDPHVSKWLDLPLIILIMTLFTHAVMNHVRITKYCTKKAIMFVTYFLEMIDDAMYLLEQEIQCLIGPWPKYHSNY